MRKIAILTSSAGECTERLVTLMNAGSRFRVEIVITDTGNPAIADRLVGKDVEVAIIPRGRLEDAPEEVAEILAEHEVELVALDGFEGALPDGIAGRYAGRIVKLSDSDSAMREVEEAFGRIDGPGTPPPKQPTPPPAPKSVDEEWAETLHLNYDASRLRTTPPPVPGEPSQPVSPVMAPAAGYPGAGAGTVRSGMEPGQEPMPSNYLVWAIVMTIFCCTIPGIVAIVFASQVTGRYYAGDMAGAQRASRNAQIWIIVSFVLGVLSSTLYMPFMMLL